MSLIYSSSWVFSSTVIVLLCTLVFLSILWVIRKNVSSEALKKNHDVAGFTFSIVGVLYSVILGFTVVNVQDRYNRTEENIQAEAMMIADLYRMAVYFPESGKGPIRAALREYVHYIEHEEWDVIDSKNILIESQKMMDHIWDSYNLFQPQDEKERLWYQQSIGKLDELMNARLGREFNSWEHLSPMMWTLLITGAVITISFMFFFGLDNIRCQMLMTALLAGYLFFMLYLVFTLDHAFKSPEAIRPDAFKQILILFDQWDRSN